MVYSGKQLLRHQKLVQQKLLQQAQQVKKKVRSPLTQFAILLLAILIIAVIYLVTTHQPIQFTNKEEYTNSGSSDNCAGCNNYSKFLHIGDDCYLKYLYNINLTNLLARIYNTNKRCDAGYINLPQ